MMKQKSVASHTYCYGCGVCNVACAKGAISFTLNEDGFLHPVVSEDKCVECGLCLKVCAWASIENFLLKTNAIQCYAAYSNDEAHRLACSSGGIGYELARYAIKNDYVFCGVKYNPALGHAEHYFAETVEQLGDSRGSKYIQSHSSEIFALFEKGKKYMVVGTPCQIDSLRRYVSMKKMEQEFILVDFFCHGVPSNLMWQKYLKEHGLENASEVKWRDKRTGWHDSWNMVFRNMDDETTSLMCKGDLFYRFFLKNRCLGKACYDDCKYKMTNSAADIRLGDLWGFKYQKDEKGVSGVITFTKKGDKVLHELDTCTIIPETFEVVTESQMKRCPQRPSSYNYVTNALKTNASLYEIDKKARRIELFRDVIPNKVVYYSHRIIEKTKCLLKR